MSDQPPPRIVHLTRAALPPAAWSAVEPIRFGQCDAAGIVYTPNYFDMCNNVVEQFFCDALAIDYYGLIRDRGLGLGYAHAACDFFKPNVMGDRLEVFVIVERIGNASYGLLFHALKESTEVFRGRFVTVATSIETRRSIPIPPDIRAALTAYRAHCADPSQG